MTELEFVSCLANCFNYFIATIIFWAKAYTYNDDFEEKFSPKHIWDITIARNKISKIGILRYLKVQLLPHRFGVD